MDSRTHPSQQQPRYEGSLQLSQQQFQSAASIQNSNNENSLAPGNENRQIQLSQQLLQQAAQTLQQQLPQQAVSPECLALILSKLTKAQIMALPRSGAPTATETKSANGSLHTAQPCNTSNAGSSNVELERCQRPPPASSLASVTQNHQHRDGAVAVAVAKVKCQSGTVLIKEQSCLEKDYKSAKVISPKDSTTDNNVESQNEPGTVLHPCRARGMPMEHNNKTAYFAIPAGARHGEELICSFEACRQQGVKFCYCSYCEVPVAKRSFRKRHAHMDEGIHGNDKIGRREEVSRERKKEDEDFYRQPKDTALKSPCPDTSINAMASSNKVEDGKMSQAGNGNFEKKRNSRRKVVATGGEGEPLTATTKKEFDQLSNESNAAAGRQTSKSILLESDTTSLSSSHLPPVHNRIQTWVDLMASRPQDRSSEAMSKWLMDVLAVSDITKLTEGGSDANYSSGSFSLDFDRRKYSVTVPRSILASLYSSTVSSKVSGLSPKGASNDSKQGNALRKCSSQQSNPAEIPFESKRDKNSESHSLGGGINAKSKGASEPNMNKGSFGVRRHAPVSNNVSRSGGSKSSASDTSSSDTESGSTDDTSSSGPLTSDSNRSFCRSNAAAFKDGMQNKRHRSEGSDSASYVEDGIRSDSREYKDRKKNKVE